MDWYAATVAARSGEERAIAAGPSDVANRARICLATGDRCIVNDGFMAANARCGEG
jgi:hypothetical protein